MARKDSVLLFIPALIGGIIVVSIFLLDLQLADFQEAYFREVIDETRRNNFFLIRFCKEQLEANDPEKIRRLLRTSGPNPVVAKIIARSRGVVAETENISAARESGDCSRKTTRRMSSSNMTKH